MAENLFNNAHKATTEEYRKGYERTFRKESEGEPIYRDGEIIRCASCGDKAATAKKDVTLDDLNGWPLVVCPLCGATGRAVLGRME